MEDLKSFDRKLRSPSLVKVRPSFIRIAQALFAGSVLLAASLAVVPWQQTAKGSGRVIALSPSERSQTVDAPVGGRLEAWHVEEGSAVSAGDLIVEIVDNDPQIIQNLERERTALEKSLRAARTLAQTAASNVTRQKELFEQGIAAKRTVELAQIEEAKYLMDEAKVSAELSRIDVRLARQKTQVVRAPFAGTILRRKAGERSSIVKAGDLLAVIVPRTTSRSVELWIDGNDAPLISLGQEVRLQFEGWPAVQFSGWPSIAVGTFGGSISVIDAADEGKGMLRVLVKQREGEKWPAPEYLRQGTRAHGWVQLGQVRLGFELWRKFNNFPPSLSGPPKLVLSEETQASKTKKAEDDAYEAEKEI